MKLLFCSLFTFCQFFAQSQRIHADLYAGLANYQGDLQAKRFTFNNAKPAVGLGLSYNVTSQFIIRGVANYMKISGKDDVFLNRENVFYRNLNFESRILEAQLALEYNLFDLEERNLTPYVFAGVAAFHFSPYTYDVTGKKEFLRLYGTEGQGLPQYPEKTLYNNKQFAIPFGGGFKYAVTDRLQAGLEIGLRKLFTDYLDDISGTYADSTILATSRGQQAALLAYRGREINAAAPYPLAGTIRGNPKSKDWYYTFGLKLSYSLGGGGNSNYREGRSPRRSRLGCPVNVY